jgi:hypothetical protein
MLQSTEHDVLLVRCTDKRGHGVIEEKEWCNKKKA